jgi:hypothetical protein
MKDGEVHALDKTGPLRKRRRRRKRSDIKHIPFSIIYCMVFTFCIKWSSSNKTAVDIDSFVYY